MQGVCGIENSFASMQSDEISVHFRSFGGTHVGRGGLVQVPRMVNSDNLKERMLRCGDKDASFSRAKVHKGIFPSFDRQIAKRPEKVRRLGGIVGIWIRNISGIRSAVLGFNSKPPVVRGVEVVVPEPTESLDWMNE